MFSERLYRVFNGHRQSARKRGIKFDFTFDEWVRWWEAKLGSNWINLRGRKRGQYVMARKKDRGGYTINNVDCFTVEQNHKDQAANGLSGVKKGTYEGEKHPRSKLTATDVEFIRKATCNSKILALKFKVTTVTINRTKRGTNWKHLPF